MKRMFNTGVVRPRARFMAASFFTPSRIGASLAPTR